jgi:hypothetical protein
MPLFGKFLSAISYYLYAPVLDEFTTAVVSTLISLALIAETITTSSTVAPLTNISSLALCISNKLPNVCVGCLGTITKLLRSGLTALVI